MSGKNKVVAENMKSTRGFNKKTDEILEKGNKSNIVSITVGLLMAVICLIFLSLSVNAEELKPDDSEVLYTDELDYLDKDSDNTKKKPLEKQVNMALKKGIKNIRKEQSPTGEWIGDISPHYIATSVHVITLLDYGYESPDSPDIQNSIRWLIDNQNQDGGWGTMEGDSKSNLDSTIVVILALNKSGIPWNSTIIENGLNFINESGGYCNAFPPIQSYAAANGLINWTEVNSPVPITCILDPVCFNMLPDNHLKITLHTVALQKMLYQYDNNYSEIERIAMNETIKWIASEQYPDGSWYESMLTYWVFATLMDADALNDTQINKTIEWIQNTRKAEGTRPAFLDLRVTNTALTITALRDAGLPKKSHMVDDGKNYLIDMQNEDGGWGWSIYVNSDIDDTAFATIALIDAGVSKESDIINKSIVFLLSMQDPSGGWRTFSTSSIPDADPLSVDVTFRVIIALINSGMDVNSTEIQKGIDWLLQQQNEDGTWTGRWWVSEVHSTSYVIQALLVADIPPTTPELQKAIDWLKTNQNIDGGWGPENISTAEDTSMAIYTLLKSKDSPSSPRIQKGIHWLVSNQNSDGSWSPSGVGLVRFGKYSNTMYSNGYAVNSLGEYRNTLINKSR